MADHDRRRFQRMKLAKPILAMMEGQSALILDIGIEGAYLEHYGEVREGLRFDLSFRWQGADLAFVCEVNRTTVVRKAEADAHSAVSHSGVLFMEPRGQSEQRLQEMMATFVGRLLAAQRANATPADPEKQEVESAAILSQMGQARWSRTRGYVAYLWDGKSWTRRPTQVGDQPRNGFTVAAYEDEDDLETLCRAYETADEEGRRLITLVAELSVRSVRK